MAPSLEPLWTRTSPSLAAHPRISFDGTLPVDPLDAAVVGGGVTGLSAALHLAQHGARVAVLERQEPGLGSTGRANGQIIAGLQLSPDAIRAAYGGERGERVVEFSGNAPALLFDLVARHRIDCDPQRAGWIQATRAERKLRDLERLVHAWSGRGAPVRLLDRDETARLLGSRAFAGGWLDERDGTIEPLAFARGMARACADAGASLHCGIEAQSLRREAGGSWRIATRAGDVLAKTVVLATNVFTRDIAGIGEACVGRSYLSAYSVQLATEPLRDEQYRSVLPLRHAGSTVEHLRLRYFRLDRERRLVIGGPGWLRPPRSASASSFRILEASTRRLFPQLQDVRIEHRWAARDTITPDLVPHLYEPAPGCFSAVGFNGRGLAIGTALGTVIARRIVGEAAEFLPYPTSTASSMPFNLPEAARFYLRMGFERLQRWLR